ncbi:Alpha/Beta hydrolase protein [Aspergillus undulatus]|uniref:Alpha/Beta hydrolase protein n=1 Tax=Aspergillus undulatus TaxID=1810928 RepID=UPI003CCD6BFC
MLSSLFACLISALGSVLASTNLGVTLDQAHCLPHLRLPYGTWQAHHYNEEADVYTYRNIRYAAAPVGELRWRKPAPPDAITGHCLFLDVYVPGRALEVDNSLMPVVVWIHGGGYVTGSKDQAIELGYYDGTSLIQHADNNLIVVTINYRRGAFGFLAGDPLQTKGEGAFNAGLHDQRAALQWVQSYIHLLGGDRNNVSAWGQSAGAGSIMYHLIAEGGTLDPLFRGALLRGKEGDVISCLRRADTSMLRRANEAVFAYEASPVLDGEYIRGPALLEYAAGNTWKDFDSIITSHVHDEASLFLPAPPIPPNHPEQFITGLLPPNSTAQATKMANLYRSFYSNNTEHEMLKSLYTDLLFTCNTRAVLEAYRSHARAMQYSFIDGVVNATHGSDAAAIWYNPELQGYSEPLFEQYQRYLVNLARTGNPNLPGTQRKDGLASEYWPVAGGLDEEIPRDVLDLTNDGFGVIGDRQMRRSVCETWTEVLRDAM